MAMVGVASGSLYRQTHSPDHLAWSEGQRPLGTLPYSSHEPGELSQWLLSYDDSTIHIVVIIIIIIINLKRHLIDRPSFARIRLVDQPVFLFYF